MGIGSKVVTVSVVLMSLGAAAAEASKFMVNRWFVGLVYEHFSVQKTLKIKSLHRKNFLEITSLVKITGFFSKKKKVVFKSRTIETN